ncbi:unnamed protein product [Mytilus edulis]|uniref:Uncharacterized protein n=1 Tax=Mytilus edulis TaxID=6550 RepID=A0A8S3T9L8_MYTED|nr:unnamed protein product [Mytilus edulis]
MSVPSSSQSNIIHRCLHPRLGSISGGAYNLGSLESRSFGRAYQCIEMKAVLFALNHFQMSLKNQSVILATDNTTVVAYLKNQGGTHSPSLYQIARDILLLCFQLQVHLVVRHIARHLNILADTLSRSLAPVNTEWELLQVVFKAVTLHWGSPQIDLFATSLNHKLLTFVSPVPDPKSFAVDAMSLSWKGMFGYAFPPFRFLSPVLQKIAGENCKIIVIAPAWPKQSWFPDLLRLSCACPLVLPLRPDLLSQIKGKVLYQNPEKLHLHAWLLSGLASEREVFLKEQPSISQSLSETPLALSMMQNGQSSQIGVLWLLDGEGVKSMPSLFLMLAFDLTGINLLVSKAAVKKTKDIFYQTDYIKTYDLVSILRDLSFYQYDEMVRMSMALLNRYYSSYNHLFTRAVQAQVLITDKSTEVFETLEKILPKLRRFAAKLNETQTKELCDILTKLIEMCHLEGEIEEQHGMNQSILYNHGILEDCFTILSQEIDVKLLDQYTGQRRVYQLTFTLLKMMARQNKTVQGRLFDRLDMLLSKEGAGTELAECLTEVFTGNSNTCMKVTGYQIQKIMELVSKNRESVPQFLDLLNAIVKVEEAEVAFVIDQDEAARFQILTDPRHKHLQYLIAMVDMLATCAEGENRFIESICQTIFKIPELLKILSSPSINNNLKKPFLRFFLWVYLNTAGGMIESGAGDLPHEKSMWVYINGMNPLLKEIADFARKDPKTTKTFLKRPPAKGDTGTSGNEAINGSIHYLFDSVMPFLQIFCRNYYQPDPSVFPDEPQHLDDLTRNFKDFMEEIAPLVSIERQMKSIVACTMSLLSASTLPVDEMREFEDKYAKGVQGQEVKSDARRSYEEYYQYEEEINRQLNVFAVNMKTAYGGLNTVHAQIGYNSDADYSEIDGDEELPLGQEFQDHITFFIDTGHKDARSRYAQAEKLVKQLSISAKRTHLNEKEKLDQIELDVKCLQLLRALIFNEIVKLPEDWESEAARHRLQLHAISDVQDALNSYDVVTSVLDHLSRPQDNVVREVLAFMATLLFNGNDCVQDNLISYFTGTREETFFFSIKSRMQLSAIATREKRLLHAMHQAKMEEAMQQAKALQKAMQTGQMATIEIMKANKIGSMLSMAKKSMANLRQSGFLRPASRLGIGGSKTSMGKKQNFGSSRLLKPSKLAQNGQAGKKLGSTVNQVAPVTDVYIQRSK